MTRKIFLAGHRGMVGSAIRRQIEQRIGAGEPLTLITRGSDALDLTDQAAVTAFFRAERPEEVILAAARVGGIQANASYPADFLYVNLMIQANVIHAAHQTGVTRLLQLGSSCIYPRMAPQPIPEEALLTGPLEPTNEPYAIAKIAGIKLCESYNRQYGTDFRSVMPTNLYGPGDNFHPDHAHVLPALMRRLHEAAQRGDSSVTIWGTGTPRREFLHVDDMARAALFVHDLPADRYRAATRPMQSHLNVGSGTDLTIRALAETIAEVVGFRGALMFDETRPDGTPRKVMNVDTLRQLGWAPKIPLEQGIRSTYDWFTAQSATQLRAV